MSATNVGDYCQLTVAERARLVLAAEARGDDREINAVWRSCPPAERAKMQRALRGLSAVALSFWTLWLECSRAQFAAHALMLSRHVAERTYRAGVLAAGGHDIPDPSPEVLAAADPACAVIFSGDPNELYQGLVQSASNLKSAFEGLARFCRPLELDPALLLGAWPALARHVSSQADVLAGPLGEINEVANVVERQLQWAYRDAAHAVAEPRAR